MCAVSMIMDHYHDRWYPQIQPKPFDPITIVNPIPVNPIPAISSEEIAEFRRLLERAREYDRKNNEPNCELAEKKEKILKLAKELGVEIDFL